MEFKELKKFIEEGKEQEVKDYVEGLKKNQLTPDGVKQYLETDEGKKVIQPVLDKYHAKSLESWKENNLEKMVGERVEQEIKNRYPEETEEQKRLKKLEAELDSERKARSYEALKSKAVSEATQKGLPIDIVDHFVGNDEDSTRANLEKLEKVWQGQLQQAVEGKFKDIGRDPHKDKDTGKTTIDQMKEKLQKSSDLQERVMLQRQIAQYEE